MLLILLGVWGGLAPFVGPYVHFGYMPDTTWHYNLGRLYFSVIPGAAALLGGLLVLATRNRGAGVLGGLLSALGGAWFVVGVDFVKYVLKMSIAVGAPIVPAGATPLRTYLEGIALFTGVGLLILFVGAVASGRFSILAARDMAASDEAPAYADSSAAGQYSTSAGGFPTSAGQFPSGGQYPDSPTQ